jgi:DNA polymerase-1
MFWEDLPPVSTRGTKGPRERGPMPQVTANGWRPPTEFPNLSAAKVIGFDTETWDPELLDAGPGWGRGRGHIIGASIAVEDGTSWYFPIRHGIENGVQILPPEHAAMNMDPTNVLAFLKHTLGDMRPKVGANAMYDVGWLQWEGVPVRGPIFDVQYAEALLNSETPDVSLDSLGYRYVSDGKTSEELYAWLSHWCGGAANDRQRKNLFLTPPALAGPYAEGDASLPIRVLNKQWPLLAQRGVLDLFHMECRLIPLLVAMRMKGTPVSIPKAEEVYDRLGGKLEIMEGELKDIAGVSVNPNAQDSIKTAFDRLGLPHPQVKDKKTGLMRTSFSAGLLEEVHHPLSDKILEYRQTAKVKNVFVKSYILDKHVNGRIFCSFHPLKGTGGGTRSGRFSSSDPNLQNIPTRTEIGKLVREMFMLHLTGGRWRSFDYSSIEYRLLAHFAVGRGADEIRAIYAANPDADYHKIVGDLIERLTGLALARGKVKTINFGIIYGMALNALAAALHLPKNEASTLLKDYHDAAPYARATMEMCANEVNRTGQVRTIMNRVSDFTWWGPKEFQNGPRPLSLSYEAACAKWGMFNIEIQNTHKALNRKLQGSAADVMKKGMVDAWEAGLFSEDACGVPILTVHDELDFEDYGDLDAPCWKELQHIMETCMDDKLSVPLLVSSSHGVSWGACK